MWAFVHQAGGRHGDQARRINLQTPSAVGRGQEGVHLDKKACLETGQAGPAAS